MHRRATIDFEYHRAFQGYFHILLSFYCLKKMKSKPPRHLKVIAILAFYKVEFLIQSELID